MSNLLINLLQTWAHNLQHNVSESVSQLTIRQYLRLVVIVGAYALLRPYLIRLGGRFQAKDHERELDLSEVAMPSSSRPAHGSDSLRSQVAVPEDSDEDDEDVSGEEQKGARTVMQWGRSARRRQRQMVRRILEEEERRRAAEDEADSDKEIDEYLTGTA